MSIASPRQILLLLGFLQKNLSYTFFSWLLMTLGVTECNIPGGIEQDYKSSSNLEGKTISVEAKAEGR